MTQLNEQGWQMKGHTGNYLTVTSPARSPRWNNVDEVSLLGLGQDELFGEIISKY
jgi:hypothetical protein